MSALSDYKDLLSKCIVDQRRPLIHIETNDYEDEDLLLEKIFSEGISSGELSMSKGSVWGWTPALGLHNYREWTYSQEQHQVFDRHYIIPMQMQQDEKMDSFSSLMECVKLTFDSKSPVIFVIKEMQRFFSAKDGQDVALSMLSSLLYLFYVSNKNKPRSNRSMIIIVSPKFDIPVELQGSLYRVVSPYPDEEDIEKELGLDCGFEEFRTNPERDSYSRKEIVSYTYKANFYLPKSKKESAEDVFNGNKKKLISMFKSMRIRDIVSILSYNQFVIDIQDIPDLKENKKRLVRDSGLLKVEDYEIKNGGTNDRYENYVGDIQALKDYMKERKVIIDNRSFYNPRMALPKGILLVGPPGCGKSESTKAIASILNLQLLSLDMGKLLSKWSGEAEHNFENAIAIAEAAQPCVLRIDEIEKAFAGAGEDGNDQSMTRIIGHFLTWMQERKSMVYIVATANNLEMLRPEFLRKGRWDEIFYLTYPSAEGVNKIIMSCLEKYQLKLKNTGNGECDLYMNVIRLFEEHPKLKISGAEIADIIDQTYQESFIKDPESNDNSIQASEILKRLEAYCNKERDVEVANKVNKEFNELELERETHSAVQLSHKQEEKLKTILEDGCYEDDEVDKQMNQIKLNIALGSIPWDKEKEKRIKEKLWKKYSREDIESYYKSKGYRSASTNE